ncbi:TPM domain-containing protein [Paracoccus sphaerophysae]|uniref:TPM domain-containing protein n=1 Tax=Paracoccus sphaerophysae TaxID=690417 RepID=UPI0018DE07AF|nr:TPM domain-containing protein [Paracoccus sphaerophysae]
MAIANQSGVKVVQAAPRLEATAPRDLLPAPDPQAIPRKTDRFVYDTLGILNPEVKGRMEKQAFEAARDHGIEVVSIVTDDLHGMKPDAFAAAMLRQLRVGKMDVGNGAVFVMDPKGGKVGLALGPGMATEYGDAAGAEQLRGYAQGFLDSVASGADPAAPLVSEQAGLGADRIIRDQSVKDWEVRFPNLAAMQTAFADEKARREATGESYDPARDPVSGQLARIEVTVTNRSAQGDAEWAKRISPTMAEDAPPMLARSTADETLMLYVPPSVEPLMTAPLGEGRRYSMIVREETIDGNPPSFTVISYDLLE